MSDEIPFKKYSTSIMLPRTPFTDELTDVLEHYRKKFIEELVEAPSVLDLMLDEPGPCKRKPWHLRLRQRLYNVWYDIRHSVCCDHGEY